MQLKILSPKTNIAIGAFVLLKTIMSIACSPIFAVQSICRIQQWEIYTSEHSYLNNHQGINFNSGNKNNNLITTIIIIIIIVIIILHVIIIKNLFFKNILLK